MFRFNRSIPQIDSATTLCFLRHHTNRPSTPRPVSCETHDGARGTAETDCSLSTVTTDPFSKVSVTSALPINPAVFYQPTNSNPPSRDTPLLPSSTSLVSKKDTVSLCTCASPVRPTKKPNFVTLAPGAIAMLMKPRFVLSPRASELPTPKARIEVNGHRS